MKFCKLKPYLLENLMVVNPKTNAEISDLINIITRKFKKFENYVQRFDSLSDDELKDFVFYFYFVDSDKIAEVYCKEQNLDFWLNRTKPVSNEDVFRIIKAGNTKQDILQDLETIKNRFRLDMEYISQLKQNLDEGKNF